MPVQTIIDDSSKRIDAALQVILGDLYLPVEWNGMEMFPQRDGEAVLVLQCFARDVTKIEIGKTDQVMPISADSPAAKIRRTVKITKPQYEYLKAAMRRPPVKPLVKVGDVPIFSAQQVESIINVREKVMANETIRVKVVAGRLVIVPKGTPGWLFECSAWEGSTINYGNRRYTYTGGQLIEDTEDVTGQ